MFGLQKTYLLGSIGLLAGCGAVQDPYLAAVRPASNVPEQFITLPGVELDYSSCKSPMVDPRDGTKISMVSAKDGEGLYEVPYMKYGTNKGEVLKLDCSTGRVIGIVMRK